METVKRPRGEDGEDEAPPAKVARVDEADEVLLTALAEYESGGEPPLKRARVDGEDTDEPPAKRTRVVVTTPPVVLQQLNEPVEGELLGPIALLVAFAKSVAQRTYHWY